MLSVTPLLIEALDFWDKVYMGVIGVPNLIGIWIPVLGHRLAHPSVEIVFFLIILG